MSENFNKNFFVTNLLSLNKYLSLFLFYEFVKITQNLFIEKTRIFFVLKVFSFRKHHSTKQDAIVKRRLNDNEKE